MFACDDVPMAPTVVIMDDHAEDRRAVDVGPVGLGDTERPAAAGETCHRRNPWDDRSGIETRR
jgi:hypothetical protein